MEYLNNFYYTKNYKAIQKRIIIEYCLSLINRIIMLGKGQNTIMKLLIKVNDIYETCAVMYVQKNHFTY
jgi:hypothetical protein